MTSSPRPPPPTDHDALPAIDRAGGIARLMGDAALFARVLARFRREYRHAADSLHGALAAGDVELAQRLAHTLKGAAGMIEAVSLREEAHALEQALRLGAGDHAGRLARLEHALERVLRELEVGEGIAPSVPPTVQAGAHKDAHQETAARLRALLEDGNGDAVDLVQEAAADLSRELGDECYRQIAAAIEVFDFEAALALFNRRG
jgi:two-component system sensor histidine kinase/response regulator